METLNETKFIIKFMFKGLEALNIVSSGTVLSFLFVVTDKLKCSLVAAI
jgi:hypothetical protein